MLDFSKIEAGKLEVETIEFDLHATVEDAVELLSHKAYSKGLEVICDIRPGTPTAVRGDPNRLRQILMNLLTNAMKFTSAGEIVVRVNQENPTDGKLMIRCAVSDTGMGIPPDRIGRLFKSFSQVDASTTRHFGGTGLGLAICKQLSELMGGQIGVSSEPGKGTTFWFTVALGDGGLPETTPPASSGLRVLIAVTNRTSRDTLQDQLSVAGMVPSVAENDADTLRLLDDAVARGAAFDAALIDNRFGQSNGRALARSIARSPRLNHTKLLLLAPVGEEGDREELREAGLANCVSKPVRRVQLLAAIVAACGAGSLGTAGRAEAPRASVATAGQNTRFTLLLAEDNEVNQLVAVELLAEAGYRCDVVGDGRAALEAAMSGQYDLLLMDCEMPVMNGFDAARSIRRAESELAGQGRAANRLPIIALTANAGGADRERCLAAGMDNYCPKPFEPKILLQLIQSLLPEEPRIPAAAPLPAAPTPVIEKSEPINLAALLERCAGSRSLVTKILHKFEEHSLDAMKRIAEAVLANDAVGLAGSAHYLKGSAGTVSAESVEQAATKLEEIGRSCELAEAEQCLEVLQDEVERCVGYLRRAGYDAGMDELQVRGSERRTV